MPTFNIIRNNDLKRSFRVDSIIDRYELKPSTANLHIQGSLDLEGKDWSVGCIVGSSGSGKTTMAKELFKNDYCESFDYSDRAVIDEMPEEREINEITEIFNSVGFGTAWSWLKPYSVLSEGEKMRVNLARCLLENRDLVVFDEFTSVVDRQVAKFASAAISKTVRKARKKFVAVTCHKDIIEWLEPDWCYDMDLKRFFFIQKDQSVQSFITQYKKSLEQRGSVLKSIII